MDEFNNEFGYGHDPGMDYDDPFGEKTGSDKKHSILDHVVNLIQAMIGIVDILSDRFSGDQ